jgi:uncharacterized protein (DUF433 family)
MIYAMPSIRTRTRRLSATPREVAGLLELPLTTVEKAIEQQVIVARTAGQPRSRQLDDGEIAALALLKDVDVGLPVATKRRLAKWVRSERPDRAEPSASLPLRGGLAATVRPEVAREIALAEAYLMARDRWIERSPEIKGGVPVIAGTRISVYGVAERVADGDSVEDLSGEFPTIPAEAFATALAYARFNPRRGRPRAHRPWLAPA